MSALYTKRPIWPSGERVSRQSTFFNNEGWQLRSGTELSGLDVADTSYTLIADPGHLTDFITAPDGTYPTGTQNIRTVFTRLISWVGFTDDEGREVAPGSTRSLAAGGNINVDIVFVVDLDLVAFDNTNFPITLLYDSTTDESFSPSSTNSIEVSQPLPNVIRTTIPILAGITNDTIYKTGEWNVTPIPSAGLSFIFTVPTATHITTVGETGHAAVDLYPLTASSTQIFISGDAVLNASSLTIVA